MSCYDARGGLVPQGFGFVGGSNSCVGPTPYCPAGASKYRCGSSCCNPSADQSRCKTCNFYETPPLVNNGADTFGPMPDPAVEGWTEIGIAVSRDYAPQIDYLTKSCTSCDVQPFRSSAQCNGCQSDADLAYLQPMGNDAPQPIDGTATPGQYRPGGNPWTMREQNAYERKTMWTNFGIGYGATMPECGCFPQNADRGAFTANGMRYGRMHAGGCKGNRCNQDPFYHPAVSVATAPLRRFRLYVKPNQCGSSRWSYAVAPLDVQNPLFTTLARDPRQPPWSTCSTIGYDNQSLYQIVTGDRIYVPGQPGSFLVNLYVDNTVPFRANAAVFRGYSPVRPLAGKRFIANSGLRNFTALPSANGLLRPF